MDSWGNDREQFVHHFGEIYDQINRNIPNNEDIVQINREELQLLRENSAQADKLAEHNSRLLDELEKCRVASTIVEGLEEENQRLAAELQRALRQQIPAHPARSRSSFMTPVPSSPASPTRSDRNISDETIRERYHKLVPKYNTTVANYKLMKDAKIRLEGIREADKLKLQKWHTLKKEQDKSIAKKEEKITRQKEEIQKLRSQLAKFTSEAEPALVDEVELPPRSNIMAVQDTAMSLDDSKTANAGDIHDTGEPDNLLPVHRNNMDFHATVQQKEIIEHRHSSSTNSDPIAEAYLESQRNAIKQELSSSPGVVFVSTTQVRKNRSDRNTQPRTKVKDEDLGNSSPLRRVLHFQDSIDLDDIGEKVDTPRKRKRVLELSRKLSALTSSSPISSRSRSHSHDHSNATEATEHILEATPAARKTSILQPRSVNMPILPRTSDFRASKKRKITDDKAVNSVLEDGEFGNLEGTVEQYGVGRLDNLLNSPSPKKQAITPVQPVPNIQHVRSVRTLAPSRLANEVARDISPRKAQITPLVQPPGRKSRETSVVPNVHSKSSMKAATELGRSVTRGTPSVSAVSERPNSKGRLSASREPSPFFDSISAATKGPPRLRPDSRGNMGASRESSPFFDNKSTVAKGSPRLNAFFNSKPAAATPLKNTVLGIGSSVTLATSSLNRSVPPSRKRHFRISPDNSEELDVQPEHEPLRLRPVQSLTIGDFKINPNYNQGYDYAFTEVVRGKDARRCIQGCVKPECCGNKIRALLVGMRDPNKPLTTEEEEADTAILEEFMGRDAYKIQNMSMEERDEMVLQAKTRDYANKHGKHRHAFEKPSSPPGFWRADWPSTQEELADRVKAKEKDRAVVEERYREAMRKGGRYLFRDE